MEFSRKKLGHESIRELRVCSVASIQPYALMLAPVYAYLPQNEKFVAIKAPLDFFTPEDLARLKQLKRLYFGPFISTALPFRNAALAVRGILCWRPKFQGDSRLPPAPFEVSDAVIRVLGPLWARGTVIEPFFVSAFVSELCDTLPGDEMKAARDRDLPLYERAILRSSWTVFLALHLGYCDLPFLNELRARAFREAVGNAAAPASPPAGEVEELLALATRTLQHAGVGLLGAELFRDDPSRAAQKLAARLDRVHGMIQQSLPIPR